MRSIIIILTIAASAPAYADWWPWSDTRPGNMYANGGFRNDCRSLPRQPCGEMLRDENTGRPFYGPSPSSGGRER